MKKTSERKTMFDWCPKCEFYKDCYDKEGDGPYYLTPECGEPIEDKSGK